MTSPIRVERAKHGVRTRTVCVLLRVAAGLCLLQGATTANATQPPITAIAFAPDGHSVVACSQSGAHVYDWPKLNLEKTVQVSSRNLHDVAFSPNGDRLALAGGTPAEDGTVEIFSWPALQSLRVIDDHFDCVMAIAWRDNASLAAAGLDRRVVLWDIQSGAKLQQLEGHSRGVSSLGFLPDGQTLVSGGIDQSLRVWNVASGELIRSLNIHTRSINDLELRPGDDRLPMVASASEDRTVRMWQPTIGRMVRFAKLESIPLDAQWLPDGSRIAVSCTDGHVRLIDPDTVEVTHDLPAVDDWAYTLAIHPTDGSILVGSRDGRLQRVDLPAPAK